MQSSRMGLGALVLAAAVGGCELPGSKDNPITVEGRVRIDSPDAIATAKAFDPLALNKLVDAHIEATNERVKKSDVQQPADTKAPPSNPVILYAASGDGLEGTITLMMEGKEMAPLIYHTGLFPRVESATSPTQAGIGQAYIISPATAEGKYWIKIKLTKVPEEIRYIVVLARDDGRVMRPSNRICEIASANREYAIPLVLESKAGSALFSDKDKQRMQYENDRVEYLRLVSKFEEAYQARESAGQDRINADKLIKEEDKWSWRDLLWGKKEKRGTGLKDAAQKKIVEQENILHATTDTMYKLAQGTPQLAEEHNAFAIAKQSPSHWHARDVAGCNPEKYLLEKVEVKK